MRTLVLNSSYEFLGFVDYQSAICAVYTGRAFVEENYEQVVRSQFLTMNIPAVVRLRHYVRVAYDRVVYVSYTKSNVLRRDDFTCQYCGTKNPSKGLSLDHVVPESRGGLSNWENTVAACHPCNNAKDNKTPEEARLKLIRVPRRPHGFKEIIRVKIGEIHDLWRKYLE